MQCAGAILSSAACPALQYYSTLSHKRRNSLKNVTEHEMWVVTFYTNFLLQHFSFQEELNKICSKMYSGLHVRYPSFLSDFNESCKFLDRFSKNAEISNFMKIRAVGDELLHAGGLSDRQT
jgi:hypothetical protein